MGVFEIFYLFNLVFTKITFFKSAYVGVFGLYMFSWFVFSVKTGTERHRHPSHSKPIPLT